MSIQDNKKKQSLKFCKNVMLSEKDFHDFCSEQTKYLMAIFRIHKKISINDMQKSYQILDRFQSGRYINKVRGMTNKPEIINNIERIVELRKDGVSHDKLAKAFPLSKATIQRYLKLLEVD